MLINLSLFKIPIISCHININKELSYKMLVKLIIFLEVLYFFFKYIIFTLQ